MKNRLSILLALLVFTAFVNNRVNAQMKMSALPETTVKPAFEGSASGIYLKVWIMTVTKDLGNIVAINNVSNEDDDLIKTHNVLVEIEDGNGRIIHDENVRLILVAPSGKKEALDLDPKSDQYGGSVAFVETGEYHLTVSVNPDSKPAQRTFNYEIYR